jgi:hypothetical protein
MLGVELVSAAGVLLKDRAKIEGHGLEGRG